jgi:hypothetical protein
MKESLDRLNKAVVEAEQSATKAAGHELSIKDTETILTKALEDVDKLRTSVAALRDQMGGAGLPIEEPPPLASDQEIIAPISNLSDAAEDAEVAERLRGKINPPEGEG